MVIQTTSKVQDLFITQGIQLPDFVNPFACWHAMLLPLGGKKALLLTHNETLYSVLIFGVTKKEMERSLDRIRDRLRLQLMYDEFTLDQISDMLIYSEHFSFFRSSDKSVMSSMNSMVVKVKQLAKREENVSEVRLSHQLNKTPLKSLDFMSPTESLKLEQ